MLVPAAVAGAHSPTIAADVICVDGAETVAYTSTAWPGEGADPTNDPGRQNDQVDISIDGTVVGTGSYDAPTYSFSGSAPLPAGAAPGDLIEVGATAVADWGNGFAGGSFTSIWVTVPDLDCAPHATGRFTGGGHQITVGGVKVTRGLTLHCDLLLSNNLEINWNGNQFHTTEHLTTLECSDDPAIDQTPPRAPIDTMVGVGTGRYNGTDGYTIEFTLVDAGEPGRQDRASILVYETANPTNVVLDVPLQNLTGGNLQAHEDQPHR